MTRGRRRRRNPRRLSAEDLAMIPRAIRMELAAEVLRRAAFYRAASGVCTGSASRTR